MKCVRTKAFECGELTCGCKKPRGGKCATDDRLGVCTPGELEPATCQCHEEYGGARCTVCADGYAGRYPDCWKAKPCPADCTANGGTCDGREGRCICPRERTGANCASCAPGYSGEHCTFDQPWYWTAMRIGQVVGVVAAVGLLLTGVMLFVTRQRGNRYSAYNKVFSFFSSEGGHQELHTIDDDDDELL